MQDEQMLNALRFLEDSDMSFMLGSPEAMDESCRINVVKDTVEAVTMALLECPHANTWTEKHIAIEKLSLYVTIQNNLLFLTCLWIFLPLQNQWIVTKM